MPDEYDVLFPDGFVRLDACMADDLSVVNAARVSFAKRKTEMDQSDVGLVKMLMRDHHGTPFEHNAFRFHVRAPIFVAREWFRHRIGSFNEFSMRYAEATDDFYIPKDEDMRSQVGKPGAYTFETLDELTAWKGQEIINEAYLHAYQAYQTLIDMKVAKEVARLVMPMGSYTEFYWTVNGRSILHFLGLRNAETAQREIRMYAEAVEALFAERMPITYRAWLAADRIAP